MPEIKEIRIRKVSDLSPSAQKEVTEKLSKKSPDFNYKGYARVNYTETSPLSVYSVEPIEGTIIDVFDSVMSQIKEK